MNIEVPTLFGETAIIRTDNSDSSTPTKKPEARDARPFKVTDKLFAMDKRGLWIETRRLLNDGYDANALFVTLWWGIKSLVHAGEGISDAKPYTLSQMKPFLNKISMAHTYEIAISFLAMVVYTRTVSGVVTEHALEEWILGLPI